MATVCALAAAVALLAAPGAGRAATPPDCTGPAGDPQPDTPQWHQREQENDYCGEQRFYDIESNPAYAAEKAKVDAQTRTDAPEDPFRDPDLLNGTRFRFQRVSFTDGAGQ